MRLLKWGIVSIVILFLMAVGCTRLNNVVRENAQYNGNVISFGEEGAIWTTWEGSFALGGINRSTTGFFSLDMEARHDEDIETLVAQLQRAAKTGEDVILYGRGIFYTWPWRSDTGFHVYKIEFAQDKK